jgi:hypothetical protein
MRERDCLQIRQLLSYDVEIYEHDSSMDCYTQLNAFLAY